MDKLISVLKKLLLAYIITAVLLVVLSFALFKLQLQEGTIRLAIVFIYAISCFVAGFLEGKAREKQQFVWGFLTGVAYFIVLFVVSVVVKQSLQEVMDKTVTTFLICAGSGMLGGMLS